MGDMPDGSEFHTAGAATLKPRETKVVRTRGTDNRLVFAERRENRTSAVKKGLGPCVNCYRCEGQLIQGQRL